MARSFVPFYHKKTEDFTLYYDYEANHFFKSKVGRQHPFLPILSGTAGIVIYALFKNKVLDWGFTYPISVVLFSLFISCILALGAMGGLMYTMNKYLDNHKVIVTLSQEEIRHYLHDGERWLKSKMLLLSMLFFFVLINILILLIVPNSGLFFFTNTGLSAALIILIWGIRPIKRIKIYKQFKKELENDQSELI
ncbi:hypothetical protein [Pueribacillus sp. YX66]|uniref:hypothetical protein n=1 Tax=Pueribacillus sp. YX66 TaxID=3229242 RepID=UPI00358D1EAB